MSSAWLFQDHRQKQKLGDDCPWSVGWLDPDGNRKSKRIGSHSLAVKFARKIEGQLAAGVYQDNSRKKWSEFRAEFDAKIAPSVGPRSRDETNTALSHFERICKPQKVSSIKAQTIDKYVAKRREERGKKGDSKVSPATINKELRHLKAVLNIAHDWKYLPAVPRVRMLRETKKLPLYVTPEHFTAIYHACEHAKRPSASTFTAADWWRALLIFAYMTGWRISEILALKRDDLDLDEKVAITRGDSNKGRRDDKIPLHDVIVEHLRKIPSFGPSVFAWPHDRTTLTNDFAAIQEKAEIALPCAEKHKHTALCHVYGFHDLRRAFATLNAETLSADALQTLMRHKSYTTTQRYINVARQLTRKVEGLHVPSLEKPKGKGKRAE